jgi:hypothetical protein
MNRSLYTWFAIAVYRDLNEEGAPQLTTSKQLHEFLFPRKNEDTTATFVLDKLQSEPYAIVYRQKNMQSHVRVYQPGTTEQILPPRASEKTPIDECLNDSIIASVANNAPFQEKDSALVSEIVIQHTQAMNLTKNKQALQVFINSNFVAPGEEGEGIGLDISFDRDAGSEVAYDFTAVGATFKEAVKQAADAAVSQGVPKSGFFMIAGADWQSKMDEDTALLEYLSKDRRIPEDPAIVTETEGLTVLEYVKMPGWKVPVWVLDYDPGVPYRSEEGGTPEDWIPADTSIFGSIQDTRWTVNRGVDTKGVSSTGSETTVRQVGDIVFDTFVDNDPSTRWHRSQTRHCFVPGNPDRMVVSVGTFA